MPEILTPLAHIPEPRDETPEDEADRRVEKERIRRQREEQAIEDWDSRE